MAFSQEVRERLVRTRAIIERGWCQHESSKVVGGIKCRCLTSAVVAAYFESWAEDHEVRLRVKTLLATAAEVPIRDLTLWNDRQGRTQAEVLTVIDKAIALA